MPATQCENCNNTVSESETKCSYCDFPQHGTKAEKITYNGKLIRLKDTLEDSDKSVKGMLSFCIIFSFTALIVLLFSLLFKENHYYNVILFLFIALVYFLLNRLGKKSAYLMAALALVFYLGHTIFELTNGIYLKSIIDLNKTFVETKGAALIFAMIPLAYLLFRFILIIVLFRFLWTQLKLKKYGKQVQFLKREDRNA